MEEKMTLHNSTSYTPHELSLSHPAFHLTALPPLQNQHLHFGAKQMALQCCTNMLCLSQADEDKGDNV